jgi:hypothetical protein
MIIEQYDYPLTVLNGEKMLVIRSKCDYRVVLDVINALNDNELTDEEKAQCGLVIFYENYEEIQDPQEALKDMMTIISYGDDVEKSQQEKPQLMDWNKDFKYIAPPISRILGYDVRTPEKYCHFWTFISAYMEIGECQFSTIISIRSKRAKNQKLEKWEEEYVRENPELFEIKQKFTKEEEEFFSLFE